MENQPSNESQRDAYILRGFLHVDTQINLNQLIITDTIYFNASIFLQKKMGYLDIGRLQWAIWIQDPFNDYACNYDKFYTHGYWKMRTS